MPSIPINTYITAGENTQMVEGELSIICDGEHVAVKVERIGFMDHLLFLRIDQIAPVASALVNAGEMIVGQRTARCPQ